MSLLLIFYPEFQPTSFVYKVPETSTTLPSSNDEFKKAYEVIRHMEATITRDNKDMHANLTEQECNASESARDMGNWDSEDFPIVVDCN